MNTANVLKDRFQEANRYANFGASLRAARIEGFRGIRELDIQFDFPVTALCGANGSGKSTILQLLACGYKAPSTARKYRRWYVRDFFPVSVVDPAPFSAAARVAYKYETDDPAVPQELTVSRARTDWSGYKRQPERECFYVGFALYIPKVERRDLSVYRASGLELRAERPIPDETKAAFSNVLNQPYDGIAFQDVAVREKKASLGIAVRYGSRYSENNMGFGEGRIFYIVDLFESAPVQSLFALEEPETSLHEDAQFRLVKYLLEVCNRRQHQVVMTTHSSVILDALPPDARKLVLREADAVHVIDRVSPSRARAVLSAGHHQGLVVCVEDAFAALVLTELVRLHRPALMVGFHIEPIGSDKAVRQALEILRKVGTRALAVLDGDKEARPQQGLFVLPGGAAPEVAVFGNEHVQRVLNDTFHMDVAHILQVEADLDSHDYPSAVARHAHALEAVVSFIAAKEYAAHIPVDDVSEFLRALEAGV